MLRMLFQCKWGDGVGTYLGSVVSRDGDFMEDACF